MKVYIITPSLIKTELEHLKQDLDDLMMDMVAADMVDEEPPKVNRKHMQLLAQKLELALPFPLANRK